MTASTRFREAFCAHAAATLRPEDLLSVERLDAVVSGESLGLGLAEELARLEPFGAANPPVSLFVPSAQLSDPRPLGEEKRHVAFRLRSGGVTVARRALRGGDVAARRARSTPPSGSRSTATTAPSSRASCCARRARAPVAEITIVGEDDWA